MHGQQYIKSCVLDHVVLCGVAADECYFKITVTADIWKLKFGM